MQMSNKYNDHSGNRQRQQHAHDAEQLTTRSGREVFTALTDGQGGDGAISERIEKIVADHGLSAIADSGALETVIDAVISRNEKAAEDFRGGKDAAIGKLYDADQQKLILEIFKGVTSEDGYDRFKRQMQEDAGGFDKYTCAIFGEPGTGKFEWVLTGRHLTIRADGDSVENTAFGGPIFYGHAAGGFNEKPDHAGNVWWHQARLANKLYGALDGKQRDKALVVESPPDSPKVIKLKGSKGKLGGLSGADMSKDQKKLLDETLRSMLNMYRKSDVDEALKCIDANGGLDALTVSYFDEGNIGDDEIWDRWMVEGPGMVWYFRGTPHVHTWVNIAGKQA